MAQQKSDRRVVPEGRRKAVTTDQVEPGRGGKAATVTKQAWQLQLPFETAEDLAASSARADAVTAAGQPVAVTSAVPKSESKERKVTSATLEQVVERLEDALKKVASNKGAPGPDRRTVKEVKAAFPQLREQLAEALLAGDYRPGDIRRVWIPKSGGGQRGLGIPNVVDRVVQEAVRQVLEPVYEPTFHDSSHGFRPGRSCHTALAEAVGYVEDGYEWVVDLDLEKFFDRVNHQRLMARLAEGIADSRLLVLIGPMLKAKVILPDGVKVSTEEGVPQGGPLSPLLSNIVLDELDRELARRGHRFVRYADDCNIYVRSERAGQRVMASVNEFIEGRLRLKVNAAKSAVARPEERHFLGFRLKREALDGSVEILLSKRSEDRIAARIRELTPRTWGGTLKSCIEDLNVYLRGWIGFFKICTAVAERKLHGLDAHLRRRLRAIQFKHWRWKRTMARNLTRLGMKRATAWRSVYESQKGIWALSHYPGNTGLRNAYFAARGLMSIVVMWRDLNQEARSAPEPKQLTLALG